MKHAIPSRRQGTLNIFDTHVGVWEEHVTDEMVPVLAGVVRHLRARGWKIGEDPNVTKNFPSIKRYHRKGRKRDLEVKIRCNGRHLAIEFFQNLVTKNKCGGEFDFSKLSKATQASPYLRLMCLAEMVALARWLARVGYQVGLRDGFRTSTVPVSMRIVRDLAERRRGTPLEYFKQIWGSDRFETGPSGWPELPPFNQCGWGRTDRDGVDLKQGDWRFHRDRADGRLRFGQVFGGINGLWWFVSNDTIVSFANHPKEFFSSAEGEPRRHVPGQIKRLEQELSKEMEAKNFGRVATLGRVLERLSQEKLEAA